MQSPGAYQRSSLIADCALHYRNYLMQLIIDRRSYAHNMVSHVYLHTL